jgi:hypothetical protein
VDLEALGLVVKSWRQLLNMRARGGFFFRHLQTEARVLADQNARLANLLAPPLVAIDTDSYRAGILRSLSLYSDPARLGGFHLFALAHLYALGKRAALLRVYQDGELVYDTDELFAKVKARHPRLSRDVEDLRLLRSAYAATRGAGGSTWSPPEGGVDVIARSRRAIERLVKT